MMHRSALSLVGVLSAAIITTNSHSREPHPLLRAGVSYSYTISDRRFSDLQPYTFTLDRREDGYFVFRVECAGKSMTCIPQTRTFDQNLIEVGRATDAGEVALRTRFLDRFNLFPLTPDATFRAAAEVSNQKEGESLVQYMISVGTPEEWKTQGVPSLEVIPVSIKQYLLDRDGKVRSIPLFDETRFYSPALGFWVRSVIHEQGHGVVELSLIR